MRKKSVLFSLSCLLLITNFGYGQKKGKVPPYEPVSGVEQADVAALIYLSLEELNKDNSDLLSKETILLEEVDIQSNTYKTNYIHYVAMMMHRRVKANYSFSGGAVHISLSDIAVQNQTNGGKWEDSKLPVKGDKKIQAKLALKIKSLNSDPAKLTEARKLFFGDLANVYVMMLAGKDTNFESLSTSYKSAMKGFGKGLTVVDADLNESGKGAKYVVTYNYTPPAAIQSNDLASLSFVQYTDSEAAIALSKGEAIKSIEGCTVTDISAEGEIIFSSGSIVSNITGYDFKKLVDTDPIPGIAFDDAFPVIYSVLESEQIEIFKVNMGGKFMTTNWVNIKDGKLGGELDGLLTFYYHEDKIWPYYTQMVDKNGKNSQCLSKACKERKEELSDKIREAHKTSDLTALKADFYSNQKVIDIIQKGEYTTTLNKKLWQAKMDTVN